MDNLYRDLRRMEVVEASFMGMEKLNLSLRMHDFLQYYFLRFMSNVKFALKDFTHSEIASYVARHERILERILKDPLYSISGTIVPIPKGMIGSYRETLTTLLDILTTVHAETLEVDLGVLVSGQFDSISHTTVTKASFDLGKQKLGAMYSSVGLSHTLSEIALEDLPTIRDSKQKLLNVTAQYYPQTIRIHKLIDTFDKTHSTAVIESDKSQMVRDALMSLAYRVSLFSVVMDKIQELEHSFVKCLEILNYNWSK